MREVIELEPCYKTTGTDIRKISMPNIMSFYSTVIYLDNQKKIEIN